MQSLGKICLAALSCVMPFQAWAQSRPQIDSEFDITRPDGTSARYGLVRSPGDRERVRFNMVAYAVTRAPARMRSGICSSDIAVPCWYRVEDDGRNEPVHVMVFQEPVTIAAITFKRDRATFFSCSQQDECEGPAPSEVPPFEEVVESRSTAFNLEPSWDFRPLQTVAGGALIYDYLQRLADTPDPTECGDADLEVGFRVSTCGVYRRMRSGETEAIAYCHRAILPSQALMEDRCALLAVTQNGNTWVAVIESKEQRAGVGAGAAWYCLAPPVADDQRNVDTLADRVGRGIIGRPLTISRRRDGSYLVHGSIYDWNLRNIDGSLPSFGTFTLWFTPDFNSQNLRLSVSGDLRVSPRRMTAGDEGRQPTERDREIVFFHVNDLLERTIVTAYQANVSVTCDAANAF